MSKKKWIKDKDLRNEVIQKHDSLDAVIEDRKKNGYPIIKPDIPGSVKGGSDEKTDKEVALFQQGLNSVINGFGNVGRGYSDAIESRKEDIKDDIYPYKLMINSLVTVADKMSAAHGILKGASMSGYLLNPTLKALAESSSAQRTASVLGFGADLTQFVTSDNPSDRNDNAFQTAGDIMNYIGGTDILRRTNICSRYGNQLDALMDAFGAGMSVYDGVIQPAVFGINNVVDTINKKEEGGEANSNEDQGKEYSPRLLDALSVLWGTGAIIPSMLIDRIYGSISGRPTDLNKALYSSIDPSGQRPDMSLSGVASLISNSVKLATKYIRGDFDKIDYLEEGKDVPLANKVAMAAWAKYNRLPYDKNLIIENPDGTYRLPREIEKSIRSDRDEIKKTYDTNLKLYNKKKEEYRNKINSSLGNGDDYNKELSDIEKDMSMYRAAVNMDAMNLNSMDSILSGKPSVFNEFNFRGRDLRNILRGKAGNLNVLGDYTMRKDEDGRIVYNDTYDLNFPFDQILGGDIYKIKGFVREDGGVVGGGLSDKDEELFMKWYKSLSKHKGLNPDPDDKNQYYDYRAFWKENPELAERMLNDDPDAHFVDTYKLPGHPTFSNESKYGGRELGGKWVVGDDGMGYYKPSPYTSSYIDRTIDYLRGAGEGVIINSEPIMIPEIPVKYRNGGANSISYQNMKDKMSDLYKEDIERIRNGKPAMWYKSLNDKPIEESHPEALLFPYAGVIQGIIDEAEDYENIGSLSGVASNVLFSVAGSLIPKIIKDPLLYLAKLGVKPARAKKLAEAIEESNLNRSRFHRYKTVGDRDIVPVGDKEKLFHNMNRDKLRWNEGKVELTPARTFKKGDPDALWWQAGSPHRGMDHGVYVIDKDKANVIGRGTAERQTWGSIDGEGAYLTGSQGLYDTEFYEVDNLTGTTFRHVFKRDGGLIEKQDYIYNRLTSEYDIPPMQAAAIVANLTHESGLQTGALGDSGASYGIQQWRDERRKNLYQFAKERGHVEPTMDDQIDYLMYEYNNGRAFQFSARGQNLYQTGKSKNKTFDYYQFSKSDFDNAASLRDAVIAWNQGVGRPNKEFAMNDRRYKIAAEIAYRHGIKDGEKNYYNDMGYLPDGEMAGIHLPEVNIVANQPEQIPAEEQKKTDYYNTYGRQIVSQMMSFNPESQSTPTSQDVSKESDKMDQDAVRISKAIAENEEAEKRKMLIEAFLPNIQLAVKGVTQVGK